MELIFGARNEGTVYVRLRNLQVQFMSRSSGQDRGKKSKNVCLCSCIFFATYASNATTSLLFVSFSLRIVLL